MEHALIVFRPDGTPSSCGRGRSEGDTTGPRGSVEGCVDQFRSPPVKYEEIAEDVYFGRDLTPIGGRARRNKISKLREYDLIDESIEAPVSLPVLNQR